MTTGEFVAAFEFPPEARVDRRIPKSLLIQKCEATAADKRQINEGIEELLWAFALKPSGIGVPEYVDSVREYLEIAVLTVSFRPEAKSARIAELIHRSIPYPVVLLSAMGEAVSLSLAHKRWSLGEGGKVVVDDLYQTGNQGIVRETLEFEEFLSSLALTRMPRADLFALYQGWADRIVAFEAARITGRFRVPDSPARAAEIRAGLDSYSQLRREIAKLRAGAAKEKQLNKLVGLNLEIRQLEADLSTICKVLGEGVR